MKKILLIISLMFFTNTAFANESSPLKPKKANMQNLLRKTKDSIKSKNPEANVYVSSASVDVGPDDSQYFDFLTSAYNQAVLQLKADIVLRKSGSVAIEEALTFHHKTIPDDLLNKELKADVDEKLATYRSTGNAEGVFGLVNVIVNQATGQIKDNEKKEKIKAEAIQNIFGKAYTKGFVKEGFDEIDGLIPTDTFIITNEKGNVEIGVVGYTTPRSVQLARDLKQGNHSKRTENEANCKSASKIAAQLKDEDLLEHFGLKYFYNENCRPSLLAYGMDSFIKEEGMNADYRNESVDVAKAAADKFISNFLNSDVSAFKKGTKTSKKVKDAIMTAIQKGDRTNYNSKKVKHTSMIKEFSKEFTSASQMQLIGLEDARIWNIDMGDYEVVGVIRYYSMDSIEDANKEFNPAMKKAKAKKKKAKSRVQHSSNLDVNDF